MKFTQNRSVTRIIHAKMAKVHDLAILEGLILDLTGFTTTSYVDIGMRGCRGPRPTITDWH